MLERCRKAGEVIERTMKANSEAKLLVMQRGHRPMFVCSRLESNAPTDVHSGRATLVIICRVASHMP